MPAPSRRARIRTALLLLAVPGVVALALAAWPARTLTPGERAALREAFGADAALDAVRIACAPLPPALTGFAAGPRIVFRDGYCRPDFSHHPLPMSQLVHEVAHVRAWQRDGIGALARAVLEHLRHGDDVYVAVPGADDGARQERDARLAEQRWLALQPALALARPSDPPTPSTDPTP